MPTKSVEIPGIGLVYLSKKRGNRNLRLSINGEGKVRVSLPIWTPYKLGIDFINSRRDWVAAHMPQSPSTLADGHRIGKAHILRFTAVPNLETVSTRISGNEIRINHPQHLDPSETSIQSAAKKASHRALRQQAQSLLPSRMAKLAQQHNFNYQKVVIKHLRSRWGSCDSQGVVALSLFLMQLPWHLIDYVILHELVHTKVMRHGPNFWQELTTCLPEAKLLRKELRQHQASLELQQL